MSSLKTHVPTPDHLTGGPSAGPHSSIINFAVAQAKVLSGKSSAPLLSLVFPAFNEAQRLPKHLAEARDYCEAEFGQNYEILVVDDGGSDGLAEYLQSQHREWRQLKLLRLPINQGKGAAVRTGMLAATGERLLFADADGATPITEERKLRAALVAGADVAIGSRELVSAEVSRHRLGGRKLLGAGFRKVTQWTAQLSVVDTQCGFKMFSREVGRRLFQLCDEPRFLFDVQILMLATRLGFRIAEVPVNWNEIPGSKVNMWKDPLKMLLGLRTMRGRVNSLLRNEAHEPLSQDEPVILPINPQFAETPSSSETTSPPARRAA